MTVRDVLSIGHPVLRIPTSPIAVDEIRGTPVQTLIDDLIDTMHHANGAGIAASQVGASVRIAVMEVTHNPRYPYKPPIPLTVAINPMIEPLAATIRVAMSEKITIEAYFTASSRVRPAGMVSK